MAKLGKIATKRRGKSVKSIQISELEQLFSEGDGIVFMNNKGLSVEQMTALRRQMRENKVAVKVAKNTLIRLALQNTGYDVDAVRKTLTGPTMVAVGLADPVSPAKTAVAFLKDHEERLEIKGGILEKKALNLAGVLELSKLPGREELVARLMGSMNSPAQKVVYALNAMVSQFAWALSAHQRKLEGAE